jgi:hypothetical protein
MKKLLASVLSLSALFNGLLLFPQDGWAQAHASRWSLSVKRTFSAPKALPRVKRDWVVHAPRLIKAVTEGGCGVQYRKVEAGESDFLDRTLKMCTDIASPRGGILVRTPAGFSPVTDGYLCVHEGPFPQDVQCPDEAPLFVGVSDIWYGCLRPSSDQTTQLDKGQIQCIDGFHLKYFFGSGFLCVDDQDEQSDLVDTPETVCGNPSAEIAFAGFAENPNIMLHCCGLRWTEGGN